MNNFELVKKLYDMGKDVSGVGKEEVFQYVVNDKISQDEYKTIVCEDCPELPLETVKLHKIAELSSTCEEKIITTFKSSCLGTEKAFDCTRDDQNNIAGLVSKATLILANPNIQDKDLSWKATGEPICYQWTPAQVLQLGVDLYNHKTSIIKRFEHLRIYVNEAKTVAEALAITWETTIEESTTPASTASTETTTPPASTDSSTPTETTTPPADTTTTK